VIRLVAIDLDGTLLDREAKVPPEGAARIRAAAEAGIHVVIITTRIAVSTRRICRELGLNGPMVCSNGAEIYAATEGPLLVSLRIPMEPARMIARMADENGWSLWMTFGDRVRRVRSRERNRSAVRDYVTFVDRNIDAMTEEPVTIFTGNLEAIRPVETACAADGRCRTEVYYDARGAAEAVGVFAREADKGTALRYVADRLGVERSGILAIGDNINDIPMLELAGTAVAMDNAVERVKRAADAVAPPNDREGVAWALRRYL